MEEEPSCPKAEYNKACSIPLATFVTLCDGVIVASLKFNGTLLKCHRTLLDVALVLGVSLELVENNLRSTRQCCFVLLKMLGMWCRTGKGLSAHDLAHFFRKPLFIREDKFAVLNRIRRRYGRRRDVRVACRLFAGFQLSI